MQFFNTVVDAIGNTPLVRLQKARVQGDVQLYAKLEYMNPGGSVKDRIAERLVDYYEQRGDLLPGGTLVEGTSGNTGVGLAMVAAVRGYRCVFVMPDKMSVAKQSLLRAYGARVVVTPTAVEPEDPRSYYSVAQRLAREIPGAVHVNQYSHPGNPGAHYTSTGPEVWEQTGGSIDYFIAGAGTGGTISGIGKYLKEQNKDVQVVAGDPVGSIYTEYFSTGKMVEASQYKIEGIGEDFIPETIYMSVIDKFVQVGDDEAHEACRRLALQEGILVGSSSGAALVVAERYLERVSSGVAVVLFPDGGMKYLESVYS